MAYKIPPDALRKDDIKRLLAQNTHIKLIVVHEILLSDSFKVLIDTGEAKRYTLHKYRGGVKEFASLASIYTLCQELGIPEFQVRVKRIKDRESVD